MHINRGMGRFFDYHAPQSRGTELTSIQKETADESFLTKAEERSKYDNDRRMIHLSEVIVTAPKIEKKEEPRLRFPLNEGSDVTIRREEFEKRATRFVSDLLFGVPGVYIEEPARLIYIRGTRETVGLPIKVYVCDCKYSTRWTIYQKKCVFLAPKAKRFSSNVYLWRPDRYI